MNDFKVETRQPQHHLWGKAEEDRVIVQFAFSSVIRDLGWTELSWCQSTEAYINRADMGKGMDNKL
jgi:hypothetical protein